MHPIQFLAMFAAGGFVAMAALVCLSLLKSAQGREDAEDERLWQYLLDPRTL